MAGSEYYGDVTVGGRSLNDATPQEWDQASKAVRDEPREFKDEYDATNVDISYNGDLLYWPSQGGDLFNTRNESFLARNEYTDEVNYKFRENELIEEFKKYIDNTYSGHYGQGGLQSSEVIVDRGHGMGFFLGNVDKYNGRYGKKGTPDDHRKDIMKIIHYGFLALYEHDRITASLLNKGC